MNGFIFIFTVNRLFFILIISFWKLFIVKSLNFYFGLNGGYFVCKFRVMFCYLSSYEGLEVNLVSLLDFGFV